MNSKPIDIDNPVVARVRQAREALAKECDYDLDRMVELFRLMQGKHADRVRRPQPDGGPASTKV